MIGDKIYKKLRSKKVQIVKKSVYVSISPISKYIFCTPNPKTSKKRLEKLLNDFNKYRLLSVLLNKKSFQAIKDTPSSWKTIKYHENRIPWKITTDKPEP